MFGSKTAVATASMGSIIFQKLLLDLVFSVDSILTAVGMTEHLPIMVIAVVVAVLVMLLALDFLLMIGMILIAEGFGAHIPKGYVYAAMAFPFALAF